jgi:hypothetical protein
VQSEHRILLSPARRLVARSLCFMEEESSSGVSVQKKKKRGGGYFGSQVHSHYS